MIDERHNIIYRLLKSTGYLTVEEIANKVNYSLATVRRDLNSMELKGLIKRVHGGASVSDSKSNESSFIIREQMNIEEKRLLAFEAAKYVKEGMSIMLDASSTVSQLIMLLSDYQNLTCITNGLNNGQILSYKTNAKTYIVPGEIVKKTNSTSGTSAFEYLNNFNCDIFFFSCRGFSLEKGTTEASIEQATIKRKMSECAKKRILLVDQSKIGEIYLGNSIAIDDINVVITNTVLPQAYLEYFQKHNIEVKTIVK